VTDWYLPEAYNIDVTALAPTLTPILGGPHGWPVDWYTRSVADSTSGWGFSIGREKSPSLPSHDVYQDGDHVCLPACETSIFQPPPTEVAAVDPSSATKGGAGTVVATTTTLTVTTGSPVWADIEVDLPAASNFASFDYRFLSDAEGLLEVYLDDQLLVRLYETASDPEGVGTAVGPLPSAASAGRHVLRFRLENQTAASSSVELADLRFGFQPDPVRTTIDSTPTPATTPTPIPNAPEPPNTGSGTARFADDPLITGTAVFALVVVILVAGGRWAIRRPQDR
jgi:hypothetical protein